MNLAQKQWLEAYRRMKNILKMSPKCVQAFKGDTVWLSECDGILYELNKEQQKIVKAFEKKYKGLVYHVIHNIYEFGECYSLLYVSENPEEWEDDKKDLEDGYAFVYVKNMDDDFCSEFGSIAVEQVNGGLKRIS